MSVTNGCQLSEVGSVDLKQRIPVTGAFRTGNLSTQTSTTRLNTPPTQSINIDFYVTF
jgi:hypothetical protein